MTAVLSRRAALKAATGGIVVGGIVAGGIVAGGMADSGILKVTAMDTPNLSSPAEPSEDARRIFMTIREYVLKVLASDSRENVTSLSPAAQHVGFGVVTPKQYVNRRTASTIVPPRELNRWADRIRNGEVLQAGSAFTDIIRAGMCEMYNPSLPWTMTTTIPLATPENAANGIYPFRICTPRLLCDTLELDGHWIALVLWQCISGLHNELMDIHKRVLTDHPTARLNVYSVSPAWCSADRNQYIFETFAWLEGVARYVVE